PHVVADEEVEEAVPVDIHPGAARAPAAALDTGGAGDLVEPFPTLIAEEPAAADAGHIEIGEAVVVVITDGAAHAVHRDIDTCSVGHVFKRAVSFVAVEAGSGL